MSSKLKFNLNVVEQKAFGDIKQAVPHYTLLEKQDFNRCFDIYTDAIDYQLVAVIRQESKPIAFYSLKLTVPKTWYTIMEKELLSIVKTLQESRTIFLGYQ